MDSLDAISEQVSAVLDAPSIPSTTKDLERRKWDLATERQQLLDDYAATPSANPRKVAAVASFVAAIGHRGVVDTLLLADTAASSTSTATSTSTVSSTASSSKWPSHEFSQYHGMFDDFVRSREGSFDPLQPCSRPEPWLNPGNPSGRATSEDVPRIVKGSGHPSMANTAIILNYAPAKHSGTDPTFITFMNDQHSVTGAILRHKLGFSNRLYRDFFIQDLFLGRDAIPRNDL